jgi:hypothetical protein
MAKAVIQATVDIGYELILNDMRSNTEMTMHAGTFESKEQALAFYNAEKVEPYGDPGINHFSGSPTTWQKTFKKGGPLEWCNPLSPAELESPGVFGHGIHEVFGNPINIQVISRF